MLTKLALNQGTIRHLPFTEGVKVAKQSGFQAMGVWSERVFEALQKGMTINDIVNIINSANMKVVELIFLEPWLFAKGEDKEKSLLNMEVLCAIGKALNAQTICAPAYGHEQDLELALENFSDFCDIAAHYDLSVGIEFLPCFSIKNLLSAYNIVELSGRHNGGVIVDAFHVFKGCTSVDDLDKVDINKILMVHLCDGVKHKESIDYITDAREYRTFPGEGCFKLESLLSKLQDKCYQGYFSVEVLNKDFSQLDQAIVGRRCYNTSKMLLEKAEMICTD